MMTFYRIIDNLPCAPWPSTGGETFVWVTQLRGHRLWGQQKKGDWKQLVLTKHFDWIGVLMYNSTGNFIYQPASQVSWSHIHTKSLLPNPTGLCGGESRIMMLRRVARRARVRSPGDMTGRCSMMWTVVKLNRSQPQTEVSNTESWKEQNKKDLCGDAVIVDSRTTGGLIENEWETAKAAPLIAGFLTAQSSRFARLFALAKANNLVNKQTNRSRSFTISILLKWHISYSCLLKHLFSKAISLHHRSCHLSVSVTWWGPLLRRRGGRIGATSPALFGSSPLIFSPRTFANHRFPKPSLLVWRPDNGAACSAVRTHSHRVCARDASITWRGDDPECCAAGAPWRRDAHRDLTDKMMMGDNGSSSSKHTSGQS